MSLETWIISGESEKDLAHRSGQSTSAKFCVTCCTNQSTCENLKEQWKQKKRNEKKKRKKEKKKARKAGRGGSRNTGKHSKSACSDSSASGSTSMYSSSDDSTSSSSSRKGRRRQKSTQPAPTWKPGKLEMRVVGGRRELFSKKQQKWIDCTNPPEVPYPKCAPRHRYHKAEAFVCGASLPADDRGGLDEVHRAGRKFREAIQAYGDACEAHFHGYPWQHMH